MLDSCSCKLADWCCHHHNGSVCSSAHQACALGEWKDVTDFRPRENVKPAWFFAAARREPLVLGEKGLSGGQNMSKDLDK